MAADPVSALTYAYQHDLSVRPLYSGRNHAGFRTAPPLVLFNAIGASIELVEPFTEAMQRAGIPSVVFDIPGVGGSQRMRMPYRLSDLAKLADAVLDGQLDLSARSVPVPDLRPSYRE